MTIWRDLAGELTKDQISDLERMERQGFPADQLLAEARSYGTVNVRGAVEFGHVPDPPGATETFEWCEIDGRWLREFITTTQAAGRSEVVVNGEQDADGVVVRKWLDVRFGQSSFQLTAAESRKLASALLAAADDCGDPT